MRVAFITQWWSGKEDGFISGLAQSLRDEGAEVSIVAGRGGADGTGGGLQGAFRKHNQWNSIPVTTYPYFFSHDQSAVRRIATYGSFAAGSTWASRDLRGFDVALVYGSPVTTVAPAMMARRRYGLPYVLHVQDVWPDSIFATGFLADGAIRSVAQRTVGGFVNLAYRNAAGVVAISPGARDLLVSRGVPPGKAHAIYNWIAAADNIQPIVVPDRVPGDPLHLMYAGNLGPAQDLVVVLQALALLPQGAARLTLLGSGAAEDSLRRLAADLRLTNVRFAGSVPVREVPSWQSTAHLNLISLADQDLFRITIPSKLQWLAAAGAPMLATAPGEVAGIVQAHEVGLTAPPGDPVALSATIRHALTLSTADLRLFGRNARVLHEKEMARHIGATRMMRVLEGAACTTS